MRPRALSIALLLVWFPAVTAAQRPSAAQPSALPVRRVVLYKTGVGYFEHVGRVRDRQDVTIRFSSAQLDDVLKSLTALDLGSGRITGISYNSIAPFEQRLQELRLPLSADASTIDLLASLRGARVTVTAGGTVATGRLLNVERETRFRNAETVTVDTFSILTDNGDVRSFERSPSVRVRIAETELRRDVARYLDVIGSARDRDERRMVIATAGVGERPVLVSYVSEVPIWKSTYRLVLPGRGGGKPLLQGWAVVDNTIGEDWTNVELSLVAGAPQSFVQRISQPYYGRRPQVPLPRAALLTPQTHQATLDDRAALLGLRASTRTQGQIDAPGLEVGVPGGVIGGVVGGVPEAPAPPRAPDAAPTEAPARALPTQTPAARAAGVGDLFEYRIAEPVTLRKNESALVPIARAEVAAEKVAVWNRSGGGRPLRALWLTNTSDLTLDGGSITVVDGNAFAGEGLIEPLKPGERRLVSYAAELGVMVSARYEPTPGRTTSVRAHRGVLIQQTEEHARWTYTARNENAEAVALVVEHPTRPGWVVAGDQAVVESTADLHRFRLDIQPKQQGTLVIQEVRSGETRIAVTDASETLVLRSDRMAGDLRRALRPLFDKRGELAAAETTLATLQSQLQAIVRDQERLRENMKALRGSAEEKALLRRYTSQLSEQETRLDTLRREIAHATSRRDKTREELATLMADLSFELTGER